MSKKAHRVRMNISIPREIRRAMDGLLIEREFSWSDIAARAFVEEIQRLEAGERPKLGDFSRVRLMQPSEPASEKGRIP